MSTVTWKTRVIGVALALWSLALVVLLVGCGSAQTSSGSTGSQASASSSATSSATQTAISGDTITNDVGGEHAIEADGTTESYENVTVNKTGDSDEGDEADFYGDNAAVFATNGATLDLAGLVLTTDGTHANGVFSYGEGTTVNVSDSSIETAGNCSGGLMTTGGGTMNAKNLKISTSGNSSAAIRSDRGGGTVNVEGGTYTTSGTGSPVIYSTADITVSDAQLESTASQGVVVEGKNSVTLDNVQLVADNNTKNSDKSDVYQAVMIYQSMSGDAASGEASFTMNGGSLANENGDVFFVNNTVATIELDGVAISNADANGAFLRAAAAGWGREGSNGGQVTLRASGQQIDGDMVVDSVSSLNLYLGDGSTFTGAVNADGAAGQVYVELSGGSKWVLTGDSWVTSLTCDADSIDLNGHVLHVGDATYEAGTASTGEAIAVVASESAGAPDGAPGEAPDGATPGDGGTPPEKPGEADDGNSSDSSDGSSHNGKGKGKGSGDGSASEGSDSGRGDSDDRGGRGKEGIPPEKPSGDKSSDRSGGKHGGSSSESSEAAQA